jgi:hypothetical protein
MHKKCWGCNKHNISIFAWLAGNNLCGECKQNIVSPSVNANYRINSEEHGKQLASRIEKNNNMFGIKTPEQRAAMSNVASSSNAMDNFKLVGGILLGLFFLWMMFGGLLENHSAQSTVNIDCRQAGMENSPYCNGEYQNQIQEQNAKENSYYQNIVR